LEIERKLLFGKASWLNGATTMDIAPLVYMISLSRKWNIKKALTNDVWITKINMNANITMEHNGKFVFIGISFKRST
jgi:hypothetical protein